MDAVDVADELVTRLRAEGDRDIDSASCEERQASGGRQFVCTTDGGGLLTTLSDYLVTVHDDRIAYRRRVQDYGF